MMHYDVAFFENNFGAFTQKLFENPFLIPRSTWQLPEDLRVLFLNRVLIKVDLNITIPPKSFDLYLSFDIVMNYALVCGSFKMSAINMLGSELCLQSHTLYRF